MSNVTSYLVEQHEGELRCVGGTCTWFKATGDLTGGKFALVEEHAARGEGAPLHRHREDDESFYVLEGEITFFIEDGVGARRGAGTFVHVPGGTIHGFRVESANARYLILTTVRHGEFYRAMSRAVGSPGDPFEEVTGEEIGKACEDFGIEFVGPLPDAVT